MVLTSVFLIPNRESFLLVKGAVLLLEEGDREGPNEETSPNQAVPPKVGASASDWQHCHLHAMVSLLRPEDSIKLVRLPRRLHQSLHCCTSAVLIELSAMC